MYMGAYRLDGNGNGRGYEEGFLQCTWVPIG